MFQRLTCTSLFKTEDKIVAPKMKFSSRAPQKILLQEAENLIWYQQIPRIHLWDARNEITSPLHTVEVESLPSANHCRKSLDTRRWQQRMEDSKDATALLGPANENYQTLFSGLRDWSACFTHFLFLTRFPLWFIVKAGITVYL